MVEPRRLCESLLRQGGATLLRAWRDHKGAASLLLSVSAVSLIGLAGLATEGGTWYLEKRHGQNAADAAAIAGVLAIAACTTNCPTSAAPAAVTAGTRVATINSYVAGASNGTTTSVTITPGTYSGTTFSATNTSPSAVKAVITRSPPRLFSTLFIAANPSIGESAVAILSTAVSSACTLSLSQPLSFTGNTTITAPGCAMASNNKSLTGSIGCNGSSSVTAGAFVSAGGIDPSCSGATSAFQPPTLDPFNAIQSVTMPPVAASATTCQNFPTTITASNTYEVGGKMFCDASFGSGKNKTTFTGDLTLTTGNTINLVPGTYVFYDASISVQGGTLQCTTCTSANGVTIILTGSPASSIGTLNINGSATVNLHAQPVNSFNAAFDGVLFYVDKNAVPPNGNSSTVTINGGANTVLSGGIYAPSVPISYSGNVNGGSTCIEIVGYQLTFTGNSNLNLSGCAAQGTPVAKPQAVRLVM